jgi:AAA15 family ATPase/GTPase
MRIKNIHLEWFRGAAERVTLSPAEKSVVIYGENGAGKSSFVDAVEYLICDGKIGHLTHEQSGKRQEKAIPNTHCPADKKTSFAVEFSDGSSVGVQIARDGTSKKTGASASGIEQWDYQRIVLRQDEVAAFIKNTKGEKYSALNSSLQFATLQSSWLAQQSRLSQRS